MMHLPAFVFVAAFMSAAASPVYLQAAGTEPPPVKREIIPGSELMTSPEREQYRQRIRAARSPQEEEQVRAEHVKQMRKRARLQGLALPAPGAQK